LSLTRSRTLGLVTLITALAIVGDVMVPGVARALGGFYVTTTEAKLHNDRAVVVLMRDGTRTVVSMQNTYAGPAQDFALIVPVPVVLKESDVKTLPREVFDRLDGLTAPRLVETWEQDPCKPVGDTPPADPGLPPRDSDDGEPARAGGETATGGVTLEAQFTTGEYSVVILGAKQAAGLEAWLRDNGYKLPAGAAEALRPYVDQGTKFLVARVDSSKLTVDERGHATLSPLRFHYDSDSFDLPVRIGLVNSAGTQDLVIHIVARSRYVAANVPNATIPSNLEVKDTTRGSFAPFYVALLDATLAQNPGAAITEYAWQANSCDPCPQPPLGFAELLTLGADVLPGIGGSLDKLGRGAEWKIPAEFVLTRLHVRPGKHSPGEDLVFKEAGPITGGREGAPLVPGAQPTSELNSFQARYIIRHPWAGRIECKEPHRGLWGEPPPGWTEGGSTAPMVASDLAFVPRDASLAGYVAQDIPEIEFTVRLDAGTGAQTPAPMPRAPSAPDVEIVLPGQPVASTRTSCGCASGEAPAGLLVLGIAGLALRRRRR